MKSLGYLREQKGRPALYKSGDRRVGAYEREIYFQDMKVGTAIPFKGHSGYKGRGPLGGWRLFDANGNLLKVIADKDQILRTYKELLDQGAISPIRIPVEPEGRQEIARQLGWDFYLASKDILNQFSGPGTYRLKALVEKVDKSLAISPD